MNKQNTEESRLDRIERGIEEFINDSVYLVGP
jgi:hypothetical protein